MSAERIELTQEGDRVTLTVTSCSMYPVGQYPEMEFVGDTPDGRFVSVLVPKSSADRQLQRLNLDMGTICKKTITIKRDKNAKQPAKPYWGIYLEESNGNGSGGANTPKAGAAIQAGGVATALPHQPPTQPAEKEKDSALYLRMTRFVLTDVRKLYEGEAMDFPPDVAAAITATLFIQAKR